MKRVRLLAVAIVAVAMASSIVAAPVLGAAGPGSADAPDDSIQGDLEDGVAPTAQERAEREGTSQVSMAPTTPDATRVQDEHEAAVERGVERGLELVQSQGVEVSQEQRAAAIDGALEAVAQHQEANVTQIQNATQGAVHGALIQQQSVNATQVQAVVGGATEGALSQHQTVNATQLQSAAWGAGHGTVAQAQNVTVEQLQVTALGAAAGAAREAGETDEGHVAKIQEAAQGAAYGVLEQYQRITVEQRQRISIEHVQHAAAGASAGAVEGAQRIEVEQVQRVEIEQFQRVTIKEVQQAAMGAAKGAIVQRQRVSVEQTQAAARGAANGAGEGAQRSTVRQVQKVSVTQIQEAALGAAKGSIAQGQEATVEQIQAAATGGAEGALTQVQRVSVVQTQHAASGAAKGAVTSAVQHQVVEVERIQAAARGAGQGAVTQIQIVNVVQIQVLAQGSASGAVSRSQDASVEQVQSAARSACEATARTSQRQRVSVTQLQAVSERTAADTTGAAADEGLEDEDDIADRANEEAEEATDEVEELTGEATVDVRDQETDGETVTVEEVDLSEGGFVAIHDQRLLEGETPESVVGVSGYLEAGTHRDVEIDLETTLEADRALIAVVHHDTDGDEGFGYVESGVEVDHPYVGDGGVLVADRADVMVADEEPEEEPTDEPDEEPEEEPTATLSVDDQTGNGSTLTVADANASVEYYVDVHYDGETVESETFDAGEDVENLTVDLEPPLEDDATVDVAIHAAEDGEELAAEEIEYTVETPVERTAELSVDDQSGNGSTLSVAEANASVEYYVDVHYDGETVESETFDAGEDVENLTVDLEPPLEDDATVDVAIHAAEDDEELAAEEIEYTVETPVERTAELSVDDQSGNGSTLSVAEANASVEYYVDVHYDGETVESETFDAGEDVENLTVDLEPPLEDDATVDVAIHAAEDDEELAAEEIEYEVLPTAELEFEDQDSDGAAVVVEEANLSAGGFVAIHDESVLEDETGEEIELEDLDPANVTADSVVGNSTHLEPGEHENVTVELFDVPGADFDEDALEEGDHRLVAIAHRDTNESETFDFVEEADETDDAVEPGNATDRPYVDEDGIVVADDATVTVDEEGVDVEFLNCTAVEATGQAEDLQFQQVFYESEGAGDVIGTVSSLGLPWDEAVDGTTIVRIGPESDAWEREDGTRVIQIEDRGAFGDEHGSIIGGVSPPGEEGAFLEGVTNPDRESCGEDVRPERPELAVENATATDDGIEVTFAYDNPNDAPLQPPGAFVEGTTDDEPPETLDPGEDEFTVTWTPESDDERLVWEVDLTNHGYEEPATAATAPAGEFEAPAEPAFFAVTDLTAPENVSPGEEVLVDATIENEGDQGGTQTVTYAIDGQEVATTDVTLEGGESVVVQFSWIVPEEQAGSTTTHLVETADDSASTTIDVAAVQESDGENAGELHVTR